MSSHVCLEQVRLFDFVLFILDLVASPSPQQPLQWEWLELEDFMASPKQQQLIIPSPVQATLPLPSGGLAALYQERSVQSKCQGSNILTIGKESSMGR